MKCFKLFFRQFVFFAASVFICASSAMAYMMDGYVADIIDGDTISFIHKDTNQTHKIRLDQIDAPELRTPFGLESKQMLGKLIYQKNVRIKVLEKDKYGRLIGTVYLGNSNVNLFMVRKGLAWAYIKYVRDFIYITAEEKAKEEHLGIWSSSKTLEKPWLYRERLRKKNPSIPQDDE